MISCGLKSLMTRRRALLGPRLVLALACSGYTLTAHAVDIQTFAPFTDNNPTVSVLGASPLEAGECWLGTFANYARQPVIATESDDSRPKLNSLSSMTVAPSCGITTNLGLLVSSSAYILNADVADNQANKATKVRLSDTNLLLKWSIVSRPTPYSGRSIAIAPILKVGKSATSPATGNTVTTGSDGHITGGIKLMYDQYFTPQHYFASNFDFAYRQSQELVAHKLGSEWRLGLAYSYLIEPLTSLSAFTEWQIRRPAALTPSTGIAISMEGQVGLNAKPFGERMGVFLAAGRRIGDGYGSPAARIFAGVEFTLSKVTPPAKPFVESEIPPPQLVEVGPGSLRLNLRDSKRRDIAFMLRGGSALTARSGTLMGGGPYFQSMSPGIYTLDVKGIGITKRSEQFIVTPGVTSIIEVTPRTGGLLSIVVRLEMPPIQFETKKAVISDQSYGDLDRLAKILSDNEAIKVLAIHGYTDNVGVRARNVKLSLERANAVKSYLIGKGVSPQRLTAQGYGPDAPITSNDTELGRGRNRRVEFVIQAVTPSR